MDVKAVQKKWRVVGARAWDEHPTPEPESNQVGLRGVIAWVGWKLIVTDPESRLQYDCSGEVELNWQNVDGSEGVFIPKAELTEEAMLVWVDRQLKAQKVKDQVITLYDFHIGEAIYQLEEIANKAAMPAGQPKPLLRPANLPWFPG